MKIRLPVIFLLSSVAALTPAASWAASATASLAVSVSAASDSGENEEFVGPFPSWKNVKTDYGATGNGNSDDAPAIQNAMNALQSGAATTVYFPAGDYRINRTITLANQQFVNIIGHDPADTIIIWGGSGGGTMLGV